MQDCAAKNRDLMYCHARMDKAAAQLMFIERAMQATRMSDQLTFISKENTS